MKLQKNTPTLKVVADDQAAQKLRELLKDADDGFRRVVKVGLYIEWIAANLPQGQFLPWLRAHCEDVPYVTIHRWRTMAKNLCEWAGLKLSNLDNLPVPAEKLLDLPPADLPPEIARAREKMEEVLDSARTPKQLFLDIGFKQGELGPDGYPRARVGQMKGSKGCTKKMRLDAKALNDQERLTAAVANVPAICLWLKKNCNLNGFPRFDEVAGGRQAHAQIREAVEDAAAFFRDFDRETKGGRQ
jgi:hypothetical protein